MEWRYYYPTEHENFSFLSWTFTRVPHKGTLAAEYAKGREDRVKLLQTTLAYSLRSAAIPHQERIP